MLLGFSRPAKRSSGIWCVATSAEASEGEEADELPRIKLPSCEAAAAMEMPTKDRKSFMMIKSRYFVDDVYACRTIICYCNDDWLAGLPTYG